MVMINSMVIKERSDKRFEGRITVNSKRKSFYGQTKTEVKNKAKEYLQKIENGYKEPQKITLNEYLEYWLKKYKWNKIEPSSYTRLYRVYECQIKNSIGNRMIGNIKTEDIQNLIDEYANPSKEATKALALSGLKRLIQLLRPCMQTAVKEGIIQNNPCNDVILPVESCIKTQTKEQLTLSDSEINIFRETALSKYKTTNEYKSRDALVLLVMLNLGLRVGEMLALEWNDIDKENKIVNINKTVQSNIKNFSDSGNTTYNRIKNSTKTKSGRRILKLNESTMFYIEELIEYDKRNNIYSSFIACTRAGTMNTARNLQRSLNRMINQTDLPNRISLHTLRHTFGSSLVRQGIGIEIVSKLMGHANITITYLKYIHVIQEQEAKAMEMVTIC